MKYLGLDLGSRTCGIAISLSGIIASVYETFRFNDDDYQACLNRIIEIVKKEKIDCIVLGYPKHMNNDIGVRAKISEDFKTMLEENLENVKVVLKDERRTTSEANTIMLMNDTSRKKRKEKKDELAAVIILQGYLDSRKGD